jgi:hypothetical protein
MLYNRLRLILLYLTYVFIFICEVLKNALCGTSYLNNMYMNNLEYKIPCPNIHLPYLKQSWGYPVTWQAGTVGR